MKKNVQFQLRLNSEALEKLKRQSKEEGITISEACRHKIESPSRLLRIEIILSKIEREISKLNSH